MQFSLITLAAALAATSTASFVPRQMNGTTVAPFPTAASSSMPMASGTVSLRTTAQPTPTLNPSPFTGAAAAPTHMAGSALGLVFAGGVAMLL